MHQLIAELHQDHINLTRLLNVLEGQLLRFQADEMPDYMLLLDLVEYVESYPDLIHHPREDIIFRIYLERGRQGESSILRLMDEHKTLISQSHALRNLLEQTAQGMVSPRAAVEEAIIDYLQAQRAHLDAEEGEVFALLDQSLLPDEWERAQAEMPVNDDPLFGRQVQQRYRSIFDLIMAMS